MCLLAAIAQDFCGHLGLVQGSMPTHLCRKFLPLEGLIHKFGNGLPAWSTLQSARAVSLFTGVLDHLAGKIKDLQQVPPITGLQQTEDWA